MKMTAILPPRPYHSNTKPELKKKRISHLANPLFLLYYFLVGAIRLWRTTPCGFRLIGRCKDEAKE